MLKKILVFNALALIIAAAACGDKPRNPLSPTMLPGDLTSATREANDDGSTLKVTAPAAQSPTGGIRLETMRPALVIGNSAPVFAGSAGSVLYRFQVLQGGSPVAESGLIPQGSGSTSWTLTSDLESDKEYRWRARAEIETGVGPWSTEAVFLSPERREGYIRPGELYDPLIDGKTVGKVVGSVTFIPGVGVRLNDFFSHIRYELPQTITAGEFSILVTNMEANNEGDKTKVMAMSEGSSDLITNDRRMTVEKRGDPMGVIAWRFISHLDQIDTEGPERVRRDFNPALWYFWKATWGGRFNLQVFEGGTEGRRIYDHGKHYAGSYDPSPHYAYIGAPIGRSGPTAGTIPGMVIRQVWLSTQPRPTWADN